MKREGKWFVFRDKKTGKLDIMLPETARLTGAIFIEDFELLRSVTDEEMERIVKEKEAIEKGKKTLEEVI